MRNYRLWTTSEIKTLKAGILPAGRTMTACRRFCANNKIKFPGKRIIDTNMERIRKTEKDGKNA